MDEIHARGTVSDGPMQVIEDCNFTVLTIIDPDQLTHSKFGTE